jgi:hypothetical protein
MQLVEALGRDPALRVTTNAVYEWMQGHPPRIDRARALVELSCGRLTIESIYRHREQMESTPAPCAGKTRHATRGKR